MLKMTATKNKTILVSCIMVLLLLGALSLGRLEGHFILRLDGSSEY